MQAIRTRVVLALMLMAIAAPVAVGAQQTTVILVRHAERADAGMAAQTDPELSATGKERAARLAEVLGNANIAAVYSTPFKRTLDTAGPVAKALGIQVTETPANATYAQSTAERILREQRGKTVLVVGHSNTTPDLAKAFGVTVPAIADSEYDNLLVVQIAADGKATVIRAKY